MTNSETFRTVVFTYSETLLLRQILNDYKEVCLNTPITNYFGERDHNMFESIREKINQECNDASQ
jgi:hypothetical protein